MFSFLLFLFWLDTEMTIGIADIGQDRMFVVGSISDLGNDTGIAWVFNPLDGIFYDANEYNVE